MPAGSDGIIGVLVALLLPSGTQRSHRADRHPGGQLYVRDEDASFSGAACLYTDGYLQVFWVLHKTDRF